MNTLATFDPFTLLPLLFAVILLCGIGAARSRNATTETDRGLPLWEPKSWEQWLAELKQEAKRLNWPCEEENHEDWRDYYEDGYSPRQAILEDMSYGYADIE